MSKRNLVLHQFSKRRVHLAGLQEARAYREGKKVYGEFLMCSSAANSKGQFGCSVIVNLRLPWAWRGGTPCKVKEDEVQILYSEPRLLIVSIESICCRCIVVSSHGPLAASTDDTSDNFWRRADTKIAEHAAGRQVCGGNHGT